MLKDQSLKISDEFLKKVEEWVPMIRRIENEKRQRVNKIWEVTMQKIDEHEERIMKILGSEDTEVSDTTLRAYHRFLKQNLEFPCQVTGIEDFDWEEYYLLGPGSKKEYEVLKKTQASYRDTFNLLDFENEIDEDQIFVKVERVSDRKKFVLPLDELKATDKHSRNYELLDDYSVWWVNNR